MSITPSIQALPKAGKPFTVKLTSDAGFESGAMTVSVDGKPRKFRLTPNQDLASSQEVNVAGTSPVSVQDWGTADDRGKEITVRVGDAKDTADVA